MKLVTFPSKEAAEVDADTVGRLRWLLEEAEAGRVVGLAFVTLQPRGEVGMGWTEGCTTNRLAVVGAPPVSKR